VIDAVFAALLVDNSQLIKRVKRVVGDGEINLQLTNIGRWVVPHPAQQQ
jgi:hypothetical protein